MATQSLEEVLRDLAKRGELNHISLTPSKNGKTFRAAFAMCSMFGISYAEDEDPAKAIIVACTTAKMKPQRVSKPTKTIDLKPNPTPGPATDAEIDALM